MKTMLTIFCTLFCASLFTSCVKDYECTCVYKYDDGTIASEHIAVAIITQAKSKKEADINCGAKNNGSTVVVNGRTMTSYCNAARY
ncbi:hypothetical protein [Edaphocola aurantiacus]|uniref:hypothetical protein n=1 Tax=Edaphocola aurantiacus TaxID=2601682 RepID=UPI001C98D6BC|nr:hypothetical protein [Edaphocola aurantiacus]